MRRWRPKYKFKIKKIYFARKSIRLDYNILVKEHSWSKYELDGHSAGSSLKTFLTEFYYAKTKHQIIMCF